MKTFNLSDWALDHRSLVWYFMIVFMVAGVFSYLNLGREEDPAFTIKTMVIQAQWPGASVEETTSQVTERIEKKLEELEALDYTRSITTPGQTTIFVNLQATPPRRATSPPTWVRVRNMIDDIQGEFPAGRRRAVLQRPLRRRLRQHLRLHLRRPDASGSCATMSRTSRAKVLTVPNVGKVDLVGAQDEVIYLEFSTRQIAALGIDQQAVAADPAGAERDRAVRRRRRQGRSGSACGSAASSPPRRACGPINLRVNDRFFRLSDVATITRGYADPPTALFRFNGQPAIGLAIGMKPGANLLEFGEALQGEDDAGSSAELPIGVGVHLVSDQPLIVEEAVSGFTRALFEAVAIVLVVSFISLGMRAGLVVALSIPLVLAITFLVMAYLGISLQRISLGALIIALGLLVDDAMIAVEMMVARLEVGDTLREGGDLCLHLDRVSDADRHAGHRRRLHPDRPQQQRRRRIHLHAVRRHRGLAAGLLDRRGAVHAAARRDDAARRR